jgi:hypothetical protein
MQILYKARSFIRILAKKMHPESIEKTAFATKTGLYELLVMPLGRRSNF